MPMAIIKPSRSVNWTQERIGALSTPDIRQLRDNAVRLNDPDIMKRCEAILSERARQARAARPRKPKAVKATPVAGGAA